MVRGSSPRATTLTVAVHASYADTRLRVHERLHAEGLSLVSDLDVSGTIRQELDVEVPDQSVLGVCHAELAHEALGAVPAAAALFPCSIVVRAVGESDTVVQTLDPEAMVSLVEENPILRDVAQQVRERLVATLASVATGWSANKVRP